MVTPPSFKLCNVGRTETAFNAKPCHRPNFAGGLCRAHYMRRRRAKKKLSAGLIDREEALRLVLEAPIGEWLGNCESPHCMESAGVTRNYCTRHARIADAILADIRQEVERVTENT